MGGCVGEGGMYKIFCRIFLLEHGAMNETNTLAICVMADEGFGWGGRCVFKMLSLTSITSTTLCGLYMVHSQTGMSCSNHTLCLRRKSV